MNTTFRLPRPALMRAAAYLAGLAVPLGTAGLVFGATPAGAAVASAKALPPPPWSIQSTANPSGSPTSEFKGVSCPAAKVCLAVGDNFTGTSLESLPEAWNGMAWQIQFLKAGDPLRSANDSQLVAVSCPSAKKCEAVGSFYKSGSAVQPLAVLWNGALGRVSVSSQPVQIPSGSTFATLSGVSCTSTSACTAVGTYNDAAGNHALAERWNGTSWSIQTTAPGGSNLSSVSCTSATSCLAVGNSNAGNLAELWNGNSWRVVLTGTFNGAPLSRLTGVSCTSATACVAVGYFDNAAADTFTLGLSWNGSGWTLLKTANLSAHVNYLTGVSCTSATSCHAVGYWQDFRGTQLTLAEYFDGVSLSYESTPNPASILSLLNGISCSAATACTAVGSYKSSGTTLTLAERRI